MGEDAKERDPTHNKDSPKASRDLDCTQLHDDHEQYDDHKQSTTPAKRSFAETRKRYHLVPYWCGFPARMVEKEKS
jgi:hypothetical protein